MTNPFPGNGFSDDELSPQELSQIREMHHKLAGAWPSVESLSNMVKGGQALSKLVAALMVIGGILAYLAKQGFFS